MSSEKISSTEQSVSPDFWVAQVCARLQTVCSCAALLGSSAGRAIRYLGKTSEKFVPEPGAQRRGGKDTATAVIVIGSRDLCWPCHPHFRAASCRQCHRLFPVRNFPTQNKSRADSTVESQSLASSQFSRQCAHRERCSDFAGRKREKPQTPGRLGVYGFNWSKSAGWQHRNEPCKKTRDEKAVLPRPNGVKCRHELQTNSRCVVFVLPSLSPREAGKRNQSHGHRFELGTRHIKADGPGCQIENGCVLDFVGAHADRLATNPDGAQRSAAKTFLKNLQRSAGRMQGYRAQNGGDRSLFVCPA